MFAFSVAASAKWHEKVLYSFQGGTDGYYPAGGVVFDNAGTFYGATNWGGDLNCSSDGCGTVFAVSRQTDGPWGEAIIYAFRGVANGATDGFTPAGGLIVDGEGNLYGTTAYRRQRALHPAGYQSWVRDRLRAVSSGAKKWAVDLHDSLQLSRRK